MVSTIDGRGWPTLQAAAARDSRAGFRHDDALVEYMAAAPDELITVQDCEGFRVRSPDGHLGFVERVQVDSSTGRPTFLAVRAGRIIVLLVPIDEVQEIDPDAGLVILGGHAAHLVPEHVGADLVLRPRPSLAPLAGAA